MKETGSGLGLMLLQDGGQLNFGSFKVVT